MPKTYGAHDRYRELRLLNLLGEAVEARLPAGLSEDERESRAQEIVRADPALTALAEELVRLAEERDDPALWQRRNDPEARTKDSL